MYLLCTHTVLRARAPQAPPRPSGSARTSTPASGVRGVSA